MTELYWSHKEGVEFTDYGGLVPPARVAPDMWLSDLPEDWQIVPVKHIFAFNEKGRGSDSEAILSLTQRGILERDISGNEGQLAESYENYPKVLEGDFVLNPMDLVAGWVARTNISGKVSGAYYSFHITNHASADARFFEYLFQTYYRERIFDPFGSGLGRMESGGGRWTLGRDVLMNFPVPLPPINSQRTLAAYLDEETSQIELLISKKEQLIENLLERKKALITQAVTKGLDPTVPMKDSGVEWIGLLPQDWKIGRLRHLVTFHNGREITKGESGEFPVYGSGGIFAWSDKVQNSAEDWSVLFGRKGSIDKPLLVKGPFSCVDTMYWTTVSPEADPRFVHFVAQSLPYAAVATQTALPSMTSSALKGLRVPIPTLSNQIAIATKLENETSAIDSLIGKAQGAVQLLKERRQALITQVVTGKLDVRGFAGGNS